MEALVPAARPGQETVKVRFGLPPFLLALLVLVLLALLDGATFRKQGTLVKFLQKD